MVFVYVCDSMWMKNISCFYNKFILFSEQRYVLLTYLSFTALRCTLILSWVI